MTEGAVGYSLDVQAAPLPDGTLTQGDYRLLVGLNAPDVLTGQAQPQGDKVLDVPIEVKAGLKILRISEVDSPNENFTVLGSLRMDWTDPELAFSPDSCNCSVKLYSDKEVDRFLAEVGSRWPAFTFFNQLGNRWIQSRAAAMAGPMAALVMLRVSIPSSKPISISGSIPLTPRPFPPFWTSFIRLLCTR